MRPSLSKRHAIDRGQAQFYAGLVLACVGVGLWNVGAMLVLFGLGIALAAILPADRPRG